MFCFDCIWNANIVLTKSWGSADLGRRPRLTLISGCYSSLCEGQGQRKRENKRRRDIKPETEWARERVKHGTLNSEVNTSTQAINRLETQSFCRYLTERRVHVSSHLLTSCAASYKEKRPQLGSPWWRSAPVVWNQTHTQSSEEQH